MISGSKKFELVLVFCALCLFVGSGCTKRPTTGTGAPNAQTKIHQLVQAAESKPTFENFIALGFEYGMAGRSDEAIAAYNRAIAINSKSAIGWNNLCAEFNTQKRYADALPNCEKAVALDSKYELAQNNLKVASIGLEKQKKIVVEKNKNWMQRAGLSTQDLMNIGMEFYSVRALENAVEVWTRIKSGDPLYAVAQNNLASSFIMLGKIGHAEKALAEALRLDPKNTLFVNNKLWLERVKTEKK